MSEKQRSVRIVYFLRTYAPLFLCNSITIYIYVGTYYIRRNHLDLSVNCKSVCWIIIIIINNNECWTYSIQTLPRIWTHSVYVGLGIYDTHIHYATLRIYKNKKKKPLKHNAHNVWVMAVKNETIYVGVSRLRCVYSRYYVVGTMLAICIQLIWVVYL